MAHGPTAIVDIGSNSVRLVVYEGLTRSPFAVHNEKAICAIGRNMVSTGKLDEDGIALALESLARYRDICNMQGIADREAVATAAARDASNGRDFVRRAEKTWGGPIRVLSGEDEARIAAEGVLAGIPGADGLVADLGGGSLDIVTVSGGVTGAAATLPFGPLRLMDLAEGSPKKARAAVEKGLERLDLIGALKGRSLYAVGGIWRALARIDMQRTNYPLQVLHQYTIPAPRAIALAEIIAYQSKKSIEKMKIVPRRRAEALPWGAIVLDRLLAVTTLKQVVISAYGLREGLLHRRLSPEERDKDPLIEFAADTSARENRSPGLAREMFEWMAPLFRGESPETRRIRLAACLLGDIGWRRHPDDRAMGAFTQVLRAPYLGADHRERAVIATAVYYRYTGDDDFPEDTGVGGLLGPEGSVLAQRIGLAARLAFVLTGSAEGQLAQFPLHVTAQALTLEAPGKCRALIGESVRKRLDELAAAFGRKYDIALV